MALSGIHEATAWKTAFNVMYNDNTAIKTLVLKQQQKQQPKSYVDNYYSTSNIIIFIHFNGTTQSDHTYQPTTQMNKLLTEQVVFALPT